MRYVLSSSKCNKSYADDSDVEEHEPVPKEHAIDYEAGVDTEMINHEDFAHVLSDGTQYRIDEAQVHRLFDALCMRQTLRIPYNTFLPLQRKPSVDAINSWRKVSRRKNKTALRTRHDAIRRMLERWTSRTSCLSISYRYPILSMRLKEDTMTSALYGEHPQLCAPVKRASQRSPYSDRCRHACACARSWHWTFYRYVAL